ncbi:hypothetical protein E2320_005835 [Naja naja]|nr:hypothetical protein E2320_005835 [Naja naja]
MSLEAEKRANASVLLPGSLVEQSAEMRLEVESLINETAATFQATQEEQSRLLDELAGKLQSLDLVEVSEKWFLFTVLTEDGADLDSIEAVANEVLNLEMPSTPEQLQTLADNIRERVESLSDVENVLQQSAGDIARAKALLDEAKKARKQSFILKESNVVHVPWSVKATDVKVTADMIASEAGSVEDRLGNATLRIAELEKDVETLRQKAATNAEDIKAAEGSITAVDQTTADVQKKTGESANARKKAEALQNEAKVLLEQANSKLQLLKKLEDTYERNQKILEDKAKQVMELEETVRGLLQAISQKVAIYSTC